MTETRRRLPPTWTNTRLGDLANIRSGFGFPKKFQGCTTKEIPFAKVRDISKAVSSGPEIHSADNYVSRTDLQELRARTIPAGTTIFAKIGEAIALNRRAITTCEMVVDNNVMALLPWETALLPRFLLHYMNTIDLYELSSATTVPSIRKSVLEELDVALPPLNEQRRIVAKIEALQHRTRRARTALDAIPPLLEKFRQSVLASAFRGDLTADWRARNPDVEPASELLERIRVERKLKRDSSTSQYKVRRPQIPRSWVWTRFGDIFDFKGGSQPPKSEFSSSPKSGYVRLLQIRDYTTDEYAVYIKDLKRWPKCNEADIMIGRYGASVGKIFSGKAGAYNVALVKLVFSMQLLDRLWVKAFLQSNHFQLPLTLLSRSAQNGFNKRDLASISVPLPPSAEQKVITKIVQELFDAAEVAAQEARHAVSRINSLEQSILAKAFRGELVPQDPNDEPASELLERIRAERAAREPVRRGRRRAKPKRKPEPEPTPQLPLDLEPAPGDKPNARDYTLDDWRRALLESLGDEPAERQDAIEAAAIWAAENMGLVWQRLPKNGVIVRGLKSALRSAIRRGEVERLGPTRVRRL